MSSVPKDKPGSTPGGAGQRPARPDLRDAASDDGAVHQINTSRFRQTDYALLAWAPPKTDDGRPESYQILAGRLAVPEVWRIRDLDSSRNPKAELTDTVFCAEYQPGGADSGTYRAEVSAEDRDARDPRWPSVLGVRAHVANGKKLPKVGEAITAMAHTLTLPGRQGWGDAYACAGLIRLPGGTFAFLRPFGAAAITATGTDPGLTSRYPAGVGNAPGVQALSIDQPSGPETAAADLTALLRFLDLTPDQPEICLALLALLAWAPFSSVPELGCTAALLAGGTGSLKTAIAGGLIAAQSAEWSGGAGIEVPVTVKMRHNQSTVFGADQVMHPLSGFLAVGDDLFADQMTERDLSEAWKRLSAIADNVSTQSGGTRGGYRNGAAHVAPSVFPRCCLLMTAERLPDEAGHSSATARLAVLELTTNVDAAVLTEIQATARATSRAHAAMIRAGLPDLAGPRAALAWGKSEADAWDLGGHRRVLSGYTRLLAGTHLIGQQIRAVHEVDPAPWLKDAADLLRQAAADQGRRSGVRQGRDMARDPMTLFARYLPQVLAGNPYWLAAPDGTDQNGHFRPPMIPGHSALAVGWRQTGGDRLIPAGDGDPCGVVAVTEPGGKGGRPPWRPVIARIRVKAWPGIHDAVARLITRETGWSLPAQDDMRRRLASAGYLKSAASTGADLAPGVTRECLLLDLIKVLDPGSDDPAGDDPGGPELPDGPPAPPEPAQATLDGGPAGDDGQAAGGLPDPDREPGAARPRPGPCRGCGQSWEYGAAGYLCPPCLAASNARAAESVAAMLRGPSDPETAAADWEALTADADIFPRDRAARKHHAADYAVISPAGLHLPGRVIPCPPPASLAAAYELARDHDIRQLWIHPASAAALALPDLDGRPDGPIGAGTPHRWAALPDTLRADPEGLAPWATVWEPEAGDRSKSGRSIVLPHLEPRAAFAFNLSTGEPWGAAVDGAALLAAVTMLSAALGQGFDYYRSPNATTGQMARRLCRHLAPCQAITDGQVAPAVRHGLMLPGSWSRPPEGPELADAAVIKIDRNQAYLSAMNTPLGIGEPEHTRGPVTFDKARPGYYRLASQPEGFDSLLPPMVISPRDDGGLWVTRADAELLADLGILPPISEAWTWPESKPVLAPLYNRLRKAGEALRPDKGTAAGRVAWQTWGAMYKSFIGDLARTTGPRNDRDVLWRPDYRDQVEAEAYARMYRNLLKARDASGRRPIAAHVDAAYFTTSESNAVAARPAGLRYGDGGGAWKDEGYAPISALDMAAIQGSFRTVTGE